MTTPSMGERIGALEIDAGSVKRRLTLLERGLCVLDIGVGDVEVCVGTLLGGDRGIQHRLCAHALAHQFIGAFEIELGFAQIGLGAGYACLLKRDIGLGDGKPGLLLAHLGLESRGFDAGEHLALLDLRGEVSGEFADIAGELRPDFDGA